MARAEIDKNHSVYGPEAACLSSQTINCRRLDDARQIDQLWFTDGYGHLISKIVLSRISLKCPLIGVLYARAIIKSH